MSTLGNAAQGVMGREDYGVNRYNVPLDLGVGAVLTPFFTLWLMSTLAMQHSDIGNDTTDQTMSSSSMTCEVWTLSNAGGS